MHQKVLAKWGCVDIIFYSAELIFFWKGNPTHREQQFTAEHLFSSQKIQEGPD